MPALFLSSGPTMISFLPRPVPFYPVIDGVLKIGVLRKDYPGSVAFRLVEVLRTYISL